jgi:hypothetical protein
MTSDPGSKEMVRVFFYNSLLEKWIKRMIHETTTRRVEAGLLEFASKKSVIMFDKPSEDKMRDCMSDVIVKRSPEIRMPHMSHYVRLLQVIASAFVATSVVLMTEFTIRPWLSS